MLIKKFILEMFSEKKNCSFQAFRSLSVDHFKMKQRGMQNAKWFWALRKTPSKACAD